ncbi:hypothetical protein [Streptomyces sp. NRRL S-378]|uniref:hypothetical protein n=1 Tax=Streptomyces sp. NRRL S-378 TaxID=1463904 RepID=UPI0004C4B75A|nr:hypothetical protein [Streptomyces sp. NRRL S-378]
MQFKERYVLRCVDATDDDVTTEFDNEADAVQAFDSAARCMPGKSRVELTRVMTVTLGTASKA